MTHTPAPKEFFLDVNNIRHHILEWGNPEAPHVLLIHGWDGSARYWDLVAPGFADRFHLVAVTLRGRGKSAEDPSGRYDFYDYPGDIWEITGKLGMKKFVYIGSSLGGLFGLPYTAEHPEQVEKLVLVDIGAQLGGSAPAAAAQAAPEIPDYFETPAEAETWLRLGGNYKNLPAESMAICLREHFRETEDGRWAWVYAHRFHKLRSERPQEKLFPKQWNQLAKITCPALVIHASESLLTLREVAEKTALELPRGEFVQIKGSGHFPFLEVPENFSAVLKSFIG